MLQLQDVPFGAAEKPLPLPVSWLIVQVTVCEVVPTSFVAVAGESEMFASTTVQLLEEAAALLLVETVTSTALTLNMWEPVPRPVKF